MEKDGQLILEDVTRLFGRRFGAERRQLAELVFNTSPVGYQEIVSDPSYTDQAVVMAYPLIGNYGVAAEDFETETPTIGALIVRDCCDAPSNFRSAETLPAMMRRFGIPGLSGVDTRKLVRHIREKGCCRALLAESALPLEEGLALLESYEPPHDAVARVSRKEIVTYPAAEEKFRVAAVDCGMKQNLVRRMNALGCTVMALPWDTAAETVEALRPDGIFLSNGPGDPSDAAPVVALVRALRGKYPMFGVCLGHQIIALACGGRTYKLKFGHRGGNHPVRELASGRIEITSQNHSYAVDAASLSGTPLRVTHLNLLDGTVEGMESPADRLMSVQYHPESAPGPQDSGYLFGRFLKMMEAK